MGDFMTFNWGSSDYPDDAPSSRYHQDSGDDQIDNHTLLIWALVVIVLAIWALADLALALCIDDIFRVIGALWI